MRCDIAVVGGGVNGYAIARELAARHGADVALFEDPQRRPASLSAAGVLGAQIEAARRAPAERAAAFAALRASQFLHEMLDLHLRDCVDLGTGLRVCGALHAARDDRELEALEARYAWQRERGAEVIAVSRAEALRLEPALGPRVAGAIYLPDEATVDPAALLGALETASRALGVRVVEARVRRLVCSGGRARGLETEAGPFSAELVVVAAGVWAAQLSGLPPPAAALEPERAQNLVVRNASPPLRRIVLGAEGYLAPRSDGKVALGVVDDRDLHEDSLEALRSAIWLAPRLAARPIEGVQIGHRPHTPDGLPFVGTTEIDGLLLATGNAANGLLLAPLCAALVADAVGAGAPPRPPRFESSAAAEA